MSFISLVVGSKWLSVYRSRSTALSVYGAPLTALESSKKLKNKMLKYIVTWSIVSILFNKSMNSLLSAFSAKSWPPSRSVGTFTCKTYTINQYNGSS